MAGTHAAGWLEVAPDHPFGLQALPYCSFTTRDRPTESRVGVAIGDRVLDLSAATYRLFAGRADLMSSGSLDDFLAAGDRAWEQMRGAITRWLSRDEYREAIQDLVIPAADVTLHLPFTVADFADFYASEYHASNVGRIFRPGGEPLAANWRHQPVAYNGRAGTVIVSGTPVRRPYGPCRPPGATGPVFSPSDRLDFEAELGFVVGAETVLGEPVPAGRFTEHVFGVCLVNDWSARDIQAWETVPLGPFLGKSFATTISPWVLPLAALEHARVRPPSLGTELLPYLAEPADWGLDIAFEVRLNGHVISRPPYAAMHWSPAQMLAHMTVNGASLRTGDLYASGTVSGPRADQRGCMLELSWGGSEPLALPDGTTRLWLEDGDELTITATAAGPDGATIGLGEARGQIMPAQDPTDL
ncbi:MAG TPA: fumarylacetoacetase [Streptosporangiaceae bacterium]|nr:fumarylacetoacetase [Streptosporangiaceae bacterium]